MSERKELGARLRAWAATRGGSSIGRDVVEAADLIDPPEPPGTRRVRIAVAMRADGVWSAFGHSTCSERDVIGNAEEGVWADGETEQSHRLTWVEASVPLPEPPATVEGSTVTP
jgi:hypothetical protein